MGHSIGGEELSSVVSRQPDRVAGLIYLEAAYPYAFDNGKGPSMKDLQELQGPQFPPPGEADLASYGALQNNFERMNGFRFPESELRLQWDSTPDGRVGKQHNFPGSSLLLTDMKKYTDIPVPALVIFANPHSQGPWIDNNIDPAVRQAAKAYKVALMALVDSQEKAFVSGVPSAHVITLPGAHHYVFLSNEADVLREMHSFLASLH